MLEERCEPCFKRERLWLRRTLWPDQLSPSDAVAKRKVVNKERNQKQRVQPACDKLHSLEVSLCELSNRNDLLFDSEDAPESAVKLKRHLVSVQIITANATSATGSINRNQVVVRRRPDSVLGALKL